MSLPPLLVLTRPAVSPAETVPISLSLVRPPDLGSLDQPSASLRGKSKVILGPTREPSSAVKFLFQSFPVGTVSLKGPAYSQSSSDQFQAVFRRAWADSTLVGYAYGVRRFLEFCDKEGVNDDARLPADEHLLCLFAAHYGGHRARSSVKNMLSAIRAWHDIHGFTWAGGRRLALCLSGVDAHAPPSSRRPLREGVTRHMLEILHEHLDPGSHFDAAVLAGSDSAFWLQARLGELLSPRKCGFDHTRTPVGRDLFPASSSNGSRRLRFPSTKTSLNAGDEGVLTRQLGPSDPIRSIESHIRLNDVKSEDALFSYLEDGSRHCLTKNALLARCNATWVSCGLPRISGHAFRIGGTSELLASGVPTDVVKVMGRWSSDAFLRYWRRLDRVIPLHAELLADPVSSTVQNRGVMARRRRNSGYNTSRN